MKMAGPAHATSFGIKSFASCVILLAMGSGGILQNSYNFHEHLNNIRTTVHHDFSASQATAQGTTKVEEKMWRSRSKNPCRRQAANNNSCTCQEGNILVYQGIKVANYQFPSVQERLQYYMGDWYNKSDWTVPDFGLQTPTQSK